MSETKVSDMFNYVEERCLWQFFSRTWDRKDNINGVLDQVKRLMSGEQPVRETPQDRLFYADAMVMVSDLRERFPWAGEKMAADEIGNLIEGLKIRLVDVAITRSTNRELNDHLY